MKKAAIAIFAVLATAIAVQAVWLVVALVYQIYKALERM